MPIKNFHALTAKHTGKANVLVSEVTVFQAIDPQKIDPSNPPKSVICKAIWDTGASSSVIRISAVNKLGLKPTGKANSSNPSGTFLKNTYLVNVMLPNKVGFHHLRVVECDELIGDFEFLIGMDIIGMGDFSVTNVNNETILSYRIPSIEKIDYVEEANILKQQQAIFTKIAQQKTQRKLKASKKSIRGKRKKERQRKKRARK